MVWSCVENGNDFRITNKKVGQMKDSIIVRVIEGDSDKL
jgi:hypothetical protein